jgi:hypothetical protein
LTTPVLPEQQWTRESLGVDSLAGAPQEVQWPILACFCGGTHSAPFGPGSSWTLGGVELEVVPPEARSGPAARRSFEYPIQNDQQC